MFELFIEWLGEDEWPFIISCLILVVQVQLYAIIYLLIKRK